MHALSISSGKFCAVHTISAMILATFVLSPSYVESLEGGRIENGNGALDGAQSNTSNLYSYLLLNIAPIIHINTYQYRRASSLLPLLLPTIIPRPPARCITEYANEAHYNGCDGGDDDDDCDGDDVVGCRCR
jgi:hypothetical protein